MRHMKTEKENYLKPQTIMEQVAMEQGICSASIFEPAGDPAVVSNSQNYVGFDDAQGTKAEEGSKYVITWD